MIYQIKNNQNFIVAEAKVEKGVFDVKYFDEEFRRFLEGELRSGISAIEDIYDKSSKTFAMTKKEVKRDDPLFGFAVTDFLRMNGFSVMSKELDDEIGTILNNFPEDNEDRKELSEKLSSMSNLEKTLLLRELKKID